MNPSRNYREYRERQRSCPLPYVPFFGLYIKDMVFQNDGNPKTLDSGYLNVEKLSTLTAMVRSFESMQVPSGRVDGWMVGCELCSFNQPRQGVMAVVVRSQWLASARQL